MAEEEEKEEENVIGSWIPGIIASLPDLMDEEEEARIAAAGAAAKEALLRGSTPSDGVVKVVPEVVDPGPDRSTPSPRLGEQGTASTINAYPSLVQGDGII